MSFVDILLGRPLASREEDEQKVGVLAGIPMLGLDALASAAYGPEAALTILLPLGAAGISHFTPIVAIILVLLAILYFSYKQTIHAYPNGGGSYTVASENLGVRLGLLSAAALLVDYVLTVAVGISAGVGALVSAVPTMHPYILHLCLGILLLIAIVNLRGVRESGVAFAIPTYVFIASLTAVIGLGIFRAVTSGGHPVPIEAPVALPASVGAASLWLLVRSFASGCTAMTGVEAVSNGVTAFAKPTVKNAQKTLTAIVVILGGLLAGIAYLCHVYGIGATDPDKAGYQSVISQLVAAIVGRGFCYYVTIGSVLAVLALSANTGFADFPRLCRLLAKDEFLPRAFAGRGRRLVFSLGIVILTVLSAVLLIAFGGITDRLIPLFAVGAFLAFTLSQAGMVKHWLRYGGKGATTSLLVNGTGAICTGIALVVVLVAKFAEGAWVTMLLIPGIMALFTFVKKHYDEVSEATVCAGPISTTPIQPPLVVVPLKSWSLVTEKALRFAMTISDDVIGIHIGVAEEDIKQLRDQWHNFVETPFEETNLAVPKLLAVSSPYRRLFDPLLGVIRKLEDQHPDRVIAVVIPELVEFRWWQYFLHNQRASALKAALYFSGDHRIVVINVPWYIRDQK